MFIGMFIPDCRYRHVCEVCDLRWLTPILGLIAVFTALEHILRETHSIEVAGTPYAHKRVSRRPFVVVERLCTTWTCLRVFLHSRACSS